MNQIHVLDQQTANSIAAGEVVERPSSVVKELVENALDAGASVINVEIRQGGISYIRVIDNGAGMEQEDAILAFGRHATSKLRQIEDLDVLETMGFRGEALASIAAVAKVRLETRTKTTADGTFVQMDAGELLDSGRIGCPNGTSITVESLFYNVPARFKFLRKDATEAGQIADVLERLSLARPDVSFRLLSNQQEILHTPGNNDLISTAYAIYGKQIAMACLQVDQTIAPLQISGLVGRPDIARNSRAQQSLFVNGRLVRSRAMTAALDEAYQTFLMKGKYAFAILFLKIPPQLVDVNVHPQKMEVRFWNDSEVFRAVYHAVKAVINSNAGVIAHEPAQDATTEETPANNIQPLMTAPLNHVTYPELSKANLQSLPVFDRIAQNGDPERTAAPVLRINDLGRSRLIGQLFQTYILLELDHELLLVDQHAAHEKILFENLIWQHQQAKEENRQISQKMLLVPLVLEVSKREMLYLQQEQTCFQQIGFEYDFFGLSSIALRSLPNSGAAEMFPEPAFRLALETLLTEPLENDEKVADLFFNMACKAAVKAHDRLLPSEIEQLLADLQKLENPYQCPHGRPVIIRLTQHELEKRFKRIV